MWACFCRIVYVSVCVCPPCPHLPRCVSTFPSCCFSSPRLPLPWILKRSRRPSPAPHQLTAPLDVSICFHLFKNGQCTLINEHLSPSCKYARFSHKGFCICSSWQVDGIKENISSEKTLKHNWGKYKSTYAKLKSDSYKPINPQQTHKHTHEHF